MTDEARARSRFFTIQALRMAGVAMVLVGILIVRGRLQGDLVAGYVLVGFGVVDLFAVPLVLARKWRSPRE